MSTSFPQESINGDWFLESDCVTPVYSQYVTVDENKISGPNGINFNDFGFPDNEVTLYNPNTGIINGVERTCNPSIEAGSATEFLYSCYDNNQFSCSIFLTKI